VCYDERKETGRWLLFLSEQGNDVDASNNAKVELAKAQGDLCADRQAEYMTMDRAGQFHQRNVITQRTYGMFAKTGNDEAPMKKKVKRSAACARSKIGKASGHALSCRNSRTGDHPYPPPHANLNRNGNVLFGCNQHLGGSHSCL
jgi:hypothetical protein